MRYSAGQLSIELRDTTGEWVSLRFRDEEWIKVPKISPFFKIIALDDKNDMHEFVPADGSLRDNTLCYASLSEQESIADIRVEAQLEADGEDGLSITLKLDNRDPRYTVTEILCMQLEGLHPGGPDGDLAILYPHHAGEKIIDPIHTLRSQRYQDFWRAQTRLQEDVYRRECNYCGLMSMTWMYLQAKGKGLYIASHDSRFPVTGMATTTGGEGPGWVGFGYRVYHRIPAGECYTSGKFVLAASDKDWHQGARRYRAWIDPFLAVHENPAFLNEEAALHQCYQFKRADGVHNRFSDIPKLFDSGMKENIRHMFIASWNRTGFDSNYPEYYPDMELGTALDFRRGLTYVKEHGGFATLYVNARLFDMKSDFYKSYGSRMAITDEKGKHKTESYFPNTFTLNCPGDEMWQHDLTDICDFAAEAYGAKGIYLDQLGSAEPFPCYQKEHSHEDIGEFNQGYLKVLNNLRSRLRARDPESFLMTENCGDIYSAYTWGNLTWNGTDYDEFYNLFRYTFPEYVQVNMVNPRSWEKEEEQREKLFYTDIERCVLMGNILWIGLCSRFDNPKLKEERLYVLKAASFRKRIAPFIAAGTYMDDLYVKENSSGLAASSFVSGDNGALLLVGNAGQKESADVMFELRFEPKQAEGLTENGSAFDTFRVDKNRVTVRAADRLTAVYVNR
jgi:hypothetical protein